MIHVMSVLLVVLQIMKNGNDGGDDDDDEILGVTSIEWNKFTDSYIALCTDTYGGIYLARASTNSLETWPVFRKSDDNVKRVADHETSCSSCYN